MFINISKYIAMSLLALLLAACDTDSAQTVTLMDGKLSFTLPAGMMDKSGKLSTQAINKHIYTDKSGKRTIIVIDGDNIAEGLDVLSQRLESQQRHHDPKLRVISNKPVHLQGNAAYQLNTVLSADNHSAWSSVILSKVNGKFLTFQITLPANDVQQARNEAEAIISSIVLK